MRKLYVWLLMNLCLLSASAQYFEWAKKGGLWAYDYGYGITTDNYGRVYLAGKYEKNAVFNNTTLPCQGNHDIYLAQYSPSGSLNWIRTAGGYTGDYATCVATDGTSAVYIGGEIEGSGAIIKFVGSNITLKCEGSNDIVIAKYNMSGTLLWARRAGGPYYEKALGITVDKYGNVYACGLFQKRAKFGGTTTVYGRGDNDIWIAKYDSNGNFLWVRTAGSGGRDEAKGIKCDDNGNVYITGLYKNGCKFGSQYLYAPGSYMQCFIAKYSPSGNLQWVKTGGGSWDDIGWGITYMDGLLYIAGEFNGTSSFSGKSIYTTGRADIFVACYDQGGNILWINKAGGKSADRARGIGSAAGKLYITGQYGGYAKFGPYSKTAADHQDIFMACLDKYGTFKWVMAAGGGADKPEDLGYESGNTICAEANGNVYASGAMLDGASFGSTYLSRWSRTDVFICKIKTGSASSKSDSLEEKRAITALEELMPEEDLIDADIMEETDEFNNAIAEKTAGNADNLKNKFADENVIVFPNPSAGNITVDIPGREAEADILIYNCAGQMIQSRRIKAPSQVNLDLSSENKGIFFLMIRTEGAVVKRKIVIQ